ncbi:uncharacterized protein LOC110030530 isoform X2 [Phalaenopsis equestris]|uniref:uncharacterized protein LOC110030530 isoform X2 n=1 Tax=Phalaenopsis equestris TaxID=78828 RepID=UPI0009E2250C|nr:uncharacterized protein LOC110030530 isoform X2 [Phalaenopsis equestris]
MAAAPSIQLVTRTAASLRLYCPLRFLRISFGRSSKVFVPSRTMASVASTTSGEVERMTAPYGSWKSPITADVVSGADRKLGGIGVAVDGRLVWVETRPEEGGRTVLVKESENLGVKPIDIIPSDFAARTSAQEYGGGAFSVFENLVIFSNYKDQRLYKQNIGGGSPVPLTPDYGGTVVRFADGIYDPNSKLYLTVMEDLRQSSLNPTTKIVAVNIDDETIQDPKEIVSGNDFYAFPRIDKTGKKMAWLEWSHPNMPWDKAQLWVGYFSRDGKLHERVCVAGGNPTLIESPSEPKWSPRGELFFVSDRSNGFWNIYKWNEIKNEVTPVYSLEAEFTRPLWGFGISSYDFLGVEEHHSIVCSYRQNGRSFLGILNHVKGSYSALDTPFTDVGNIVAGSNCIFIEGASATHPISIVKITLDSNNAQVPLFSVIWSSSEDAAKYRSYFSSPEIVKFSTESGQDAYAYFYPPSNPDYQASADEKPPLIVKSHGGPTAESRGILDLNIQYWTSRGWAFADVNYGGSTGYGREYRERLLGQWGVVDVNDCCRCARFLADKGNVDEERLCMTGRSAGGYTTLACLAFRETFKAGASLYGVADLSSLREETHKFESHYIDNLVGDENAYFEKSPINFVDKFNCPVILFQGLDDKIVSPEQARKIYNALKEKGVPVALVEFEGEQHGFRKQMVFFARTVGHFKVADPIVPIKIDNFD